MLFPINELVITDLQEYVPLIERNISLNENKKDNWISRCRAEDLDWCNLKEQHKLNKFDVIFAFEWYVKYFSHVGRSLITIMLVYIKRNCIHLLLMP